MAFDLLFVCGNKTGGPGTASFKRGGGIGGFEPLLCVC